MGKRKTSSANTAAFKGKPSFEGSFKFTALTGKGWIRVPINMGVLKTVREETNRYLLEFNGFGSTIEAWFSKNSKWANENFQKFQTGNGYILKGNIVAQGKSSRYHLSSNSSGRYVLMFDKINWLESKICSSDSSNSQSPSFSSMKAMIRDQKPFAKDIKNIKITSGNVYRYRGCESEDCFAKVVFKNGTYKCRLCNRTYGPSGGKIRVCIQDIRIQNNVGNELHDLVCFHQACEELLGKENIQKLSKLSDWYVVKAFEKCLGASLSATLKHKRSITGIKSFSLVIENIQHTDKNFSSVIDENLFVTFNTVRSDTSDAHYCCEGSSDDENDTFDLSKKIDDLKKSLPRSSRCENAPGNYLIDRRYSLWENENTKYFGLALVVNIKNYDKHSPRHGSEKDVESISRVLSKHRIGLFNKKVYEDINLKEFKTAIEDFKTDLKEKDYSCCFVFVMGHGASNQIALRNSDDRVHIYTDIIYKFAGQQNIFPEFTGKPKVFVFQSCQDFKASDYNAEVPGYSTEDMLWCMPCAPGMKAKRNRKNGSYFIQTLTSLLDEFGVERNIVDIIKMTQNVMKDIHFGEENEKNIPQYSANCFSDLYFVGKIPVPSYDCDNSIIIA